MAYSARPIVYVPTLAAGADLDRALASLAEQTVGVGVVVVDNRSPGAGPVAAAFPDADIVAPGVNLGFGPALNFAVRERPAQTLIFLNDDVVCRPRFVEALLEEAGAGTAAVAGVLLQADRPDRIDSAGVVADRTLLAFDYLHGEPRDAAAGAAPPLGPTGGAALLRLDAFNALRGFDERIFAYLEDLDLALRLRARGESCRLAGDAQALHRHSATLGAGSARKNALMGWSRGYLLRRYGVLRTPGRAARAIAGEAMLCAGQLAVDHTAAGITARARGWRAARGTSRRPIPADDLLDVSFSEALRRRTLRRQGR